MTKIQAMLNLLLLAGSMTAGAAPQPEISVRLKGQLGNQMFQIAAVHAHARRLGCSYGVPDLVNRPQFFGIGPNYKEVFSKVPTALKMVPRKRFIEKDGWHYQDIPLRPNTMIEGYFQSEKYFADYADEIRDLFSTVNDRWKSLQEEHPCLNAGLKVGVHVRVNADRQFDSPSFHPTFGQRYYEEALAHLPPDALYVVCSNNTAAARKILCGINRNFEFMEKTNRFDDLAILSNCDHIVGSNSSFSWWAAWLGDRAGRRCIFPFPWHRDVPTPGDAPDLLPDRWMALNCPEAVIPLSDLSALATTSSAFKH